MMDISKTSSYAGIDRTLCAGQYQDRRHSCASFTNLSKNDIKANTNAFSLKPQSYLAGKLSSWGYNQGSKAFVCGLFQLH